MELSASEEMTISEAAAAAGVSAHTLRYYERVGLLDAVARGDSGHRRFGAADLERVRFIGYLRNTGMPIRRIRRFVDLYREGEHTVPERLELLQRHRESVRAELDETQRNLAAIERKIRIYRERNGS